MQESWDDLWSVERSEEAGGRVRVSLVRRREHHFSKHLVAHTETVQSTVLFSHSFRPLLETVAMEHYAGQLSRIAEHAQDGKFGCFIENRAEDGMVAITLYDRWFVEPDIRTEELARRVFDASDEASLVASAEFVADLRIWADQRNDDRETTLLQERDADAAGRRLSAEQEAASRELSQILAAHARQS